MRRLGLAAVAVTSMWARASGAANAEGRSVVVLVEGADANAIAAGVSAHVAAPNTATDPAPRLAGHAPLPTIFLWSCDAATIAQGRGEGQW